MRDGGVLNPLVAPMPSLCGGLVDDGHWDGWFLQTQDFEEVLLLAILFFAQDCLALILGTDLIYLSSVVGSPVSHSISSGSIQLVGVFGNDTRG